MKTAETSVMEYLKSETSYDMLLVIVAFVAVIIVSGSSTPKIY